MSLLGTMFRRRTSDSDVEKELRFHIEQQIDDYMRAGLSREEAARRTRLEFGGLQQIKEECQDVFLVRWLSDLGRDIRLGVRGFRRSPTFFVVSVLTLALGIGANTAIFTLVNSLVLRTLPVADPDRLVVLTTGGPGDGRYYWSSASWDEVRARPQIFGDAAAWNSTRFNLSSRGESDLVEGLWVSGSFFRVLGVPAWRGRMLTDADDQRGGGQDGPVAVISYAFWQRRFNGATDAVGRTLFVGALPFRIVGISPPDFFGAEVGRTFDVAAPAADEPLVTGVARDPLVARARYWLNIVARLRTGETVADFNRAFRAAQPEMRAATIPPLPASLLYRYLEDPFTALPAATGLSILRGRYRRPLLTILVVVALVLLIACANIANLMLARAAERQREMSARLALGATRWRLIRQLIAESAVLAGTGTALGIVMASWGSRMLARQLSTQANTVFLDLTLDWRVLGFSIAAGVVAAVLFGLVPAFTASGVAPMAALQDGARNTRIYARGLLPNVLLVAQVALALMLVIAATLFVRTLVSLATLATGFDAERVLLVNLNSQQLKTDAAHRMELFDRAWRGVRSVPGVSHAALSSITPLSGLGMLPQIEVSGGVAVPRDRLGSNSAENVVSPGWFATMGTPVIAGRDFTDFDRDGAPLVAIVNQALARKFLNGENPIGHTITQSLADPTRTHPIEIVGLAADAAYSSLRAPVPPTVYLSLAQFASTLPPPSQQSITVSVRATAGSPAVLTHDVASAITNVDPQLILTFRTLADQVNASLTRERLVAMLGGFFGSLALLLAALGLYGVTSYSVSRRRAEIGVRMALGAAPGGILRLVLSRVSLLVAIGVGIGAVLSMWASSFVASLLYDLEPRDPVTLISAALILIAVGLLAGWLPARRAARLDPAVTLRSE